MSVVYREAKAHQKQLGRSRAPTRTMLVQSAITVFASTASINDNPVKILVLDEADALTHGMQQALRRTMELYSDICRFILITPTLSGWSPAILSRCNLIRFPNVDEESVSKLIHSIAEQESVQLERNATAAIARESSGDLRRAINLLQVASIATGSVTEDAVYQHSETHLTSSTRQIVSGAIKGDFSLARKNLRNLLTVDGYRAQEVCQEIARDLITRPFEPVLLSDILTRVAEIDYRLTQSKNQFIQLTALLVSIWAMTSEANTGS
jgi:replication factor C small subunit